MLTLMVGGRVTRKTRLQNMKAATKKGEGEEKIAQGKTGRVGTVGQIQQEKGGGPSLSATDDCEYTNDILPFQKDVYVGGIIEAIIGTLRAPQTGGERIRAYWRGRVGGAEVLERIAR